MTPLTKEQAREKCLVGWNIRCNFCGSYGAEWVSNQRPGWGDLAMCPAHKKEIEDELHRHAVAMERLRNINFEQDIPEPYHGPQVWD